MELFKKVIAEIIGTFCLVFMGCGTAMLVGCDVTGGYLLTALAFGLTIVAMAYSIGNISGCHVNPAVSVAVWINKGMKTSEMFAYICAQIIGALIGSGVLMLIFKSAGIEDKTGGFGANGLAGVSGSIAAGFAVECILTFLFVICILGVTSKKFGHGSLAGLVIGLTLTFVHIFGIGLTGTSVNPARSLAPAIMNAVNGNQEALGVVWIFIVAPVLGAILAAVIYRLLEGSSEAN